MDILDDMGVSKLLTKVFLKVNYSFKDCTLWKCMNALITCERLND